MQVLSLRGESRRVKLAMTAVLLVYLLLALWEIDWGTPLPWHPDEKQTAAQTLIVKRTVNPNHFTYGGLPYYMLAVGANLPATLYTYAFDPRPAVDDPERDAWRDRQLTRMIVAGRLLSVLLGAGLLLITFSIGRALYDPLVGLIGAAALAVSPHFIAICHFAIVDVAGNFWFWLAMLLSLGVYREGTRGWYAASAFTLGLASGVKIDRILGALPLLLAHWMRGQGLGLGRVMLFAFAGLAGYLLSNLTIFTDFFTFAHGTIRELFFGILRGEEDLTSFGAIFGHVADGMGWPLLLLAAGGLLAMTADALRGRGSAELVWLTATVAPSYLLFGSRLSASWYAPFYFPAIAIAAAYAVRWLLDRGGWPGRAVASLIVPVALGWALLLSMTFDHALSNDARYRASAWIADNVPAGATIEVGLRAPRVDSSRHVPVNRGRSESSRETFDAWRERLDSHPPYQKINQSLAALESWYVERMGGEPRAEYRAWFDFDPVAPTADEPAALPDYRVVLIGTETRLLERLSAPDSGYRLVADFPPTRFLGQAATFPFVNPRVIVFQRSDAPR